MINKLFDSPEAALADVPDGATVMIGGFGTAGLPNELIDALHRPGRARADGRQQQRRQRRHRPGRAAGRQARAQDHLLAFRARPIRTTSTGLYRAARSSSNWCRRATWPSASAPRAPASAASSRPPAMAPSWRKGKETRVIDGRGYVLEAPIHADFALIKAERGDRWGNLVYRKTARNFGPVMAMAATRHGGHGARDGRTRRRSTRSTSSRRGSSCSAWCRSSARPPRPAASRQAA